MAIIGIVAVAENLAIGKDGKLPWHYSEDLKFFKRTTSGHTVVMGYNTWLSIGKPLPKRLNVIMSRSRSIEYKERVLVLRNVDDAVVLSKYINGDMFIIGGTHTYRSFAHVIEKWIVTRIPETIENADAFMPSDFLDEFESSASEELAGGLEVQTYLRE
ncbi:MAG: dihydrofolate reductase [Pyrinomonadaceae bacterium]|nr:dihydrofolate reductase [Pyrinomonadaceae bacterium]